MTEILVLFRGSCPDGFTAAWAAWRKFGDAATYQPCAYGKDKIPDVTGKEVYIVDFSFKRDVLIDMASKAKSIVLLDHHKTALEDLDGLVVPGLEIHFDMNRSGAGLTWDYFFPGEPNWLVNYVQDRDLWKFNLPDSHVVNAFITALPYDFARFNQVFEDGAETAKVLGRGAHAWIRYYVENTKRTATKMRFLGHGNIPVVNAPYSSISEVVGELCEQEQSEFAVGWQWRDGTVTYSLRSRGGFDVAALAQTMGGGGHKAASGFRSEKLPWDLAEPQS